MNILIIGGTGFIGKEVIKQLVVEEVSLTLLVRNKAKAAALTELASSKIQLVTGDLTQPNLGLNEMDKKKVLKSQVILHCGGPMDITLSEELAKTAFLEGSKRVMDLAEEIHQHTGLQRLVHIVGYMSPINDNDNSWKNMDVFRDEHPDLIDAPPYEKMKFLADIYIRQEAKKNKIPLTVINPPTVIGDDQTGSTEQLGGLGLFIKIIRNGFLPVIPGGKNYRLPLINNNILAQFIVETIISDSKGNETYTFVPDKKSDRNIATLMSLISESMNIKTPRVTVPHWLLTFIMSFGGSKLTGVPKASLNFLTNESFNNQSVKENFEPELVSKMPASNIPQTIADIDFRQTFTDQNIMPYERKSINGITYYHLKGSDKPIILFHGLFSDGTDLFNLGLELNKQTNKAIFIVDLPGFGRSPFIKNPNILTPYIEMIQSIKELVPQGSSFIGHSFGAALLIEAFSRKILLDTDKIILLQPPVNKTIKEPYNWLSKIILKNTSYKQLAKYFNRNGLLVAIDAVSDNYLKRVMESIESPRILNTTLQLNKELKKIALNNKMNDSFHVIWGTEDKSYTFKTVNSQISTLPQGHYFPISNPKETAEIIIEMLNNK
ncbi:MAG: alpha/beta fold hydrolase [Vagococcus sp.]|uniref:alpha/beta fold hydrolase n=1 Tax=Vagococcus sp. TaxID=1933889 RepID=UPI002FC7801F